VMWNAIIVSASVEEMLTREHSECTNIVTEFVVPFTNCFCYVIAYGMYSVIMWYIQYG